MNKNKPKRAPSGMGERALRLWRQVADNYELRADEWRILEDACRETALVDLLQKELRGAPLIMKGSMGQPVSNPLLAEIAAHRRLAASLFKQLGLPDLDSADIDGSEEPGARSAAAREAAKSRWTVAHGKAG